MDRASRIQRFLGFFDNLSEKWKSMLDFGGLLQESFDQLENPESSKSLLLEDTLLTLRSTLVCLTVALMAFYRDLWTVCVFVYSSGSRSLNSLP